MQVFIDHYTEWGIPQTTSLEDIQKKLWELRSDWAERKLSAPDEANLKLREIDDAFKVFQSEESRRIYDHDLAESKKAPLIIDPDAERKEAFEKWYTDAKQYFDTAQYDLAKTAIDRAFAVLPPQGANYSFYAWAADIYSKTGHHIQALEYVNQAIVIVPENPFVYDVKQIVLGRYSFDTSGGVNTQAKLFLQRESVLKQMIDKAQQTGNSGYVAQGYGHLAYMYCFLAYYKQRYDSTSDALEYARSAIEVDPEEPNAKSVIEEVQRQNKLKEAEVALAEKIISTAANVAQGMKNTSFDSGVDGWVFFQTDIHYIEDDWSDGAVARNAWWEYETHDIIKYVLSENGKILICKSKDIKETKCGDGGGKAEQQNLGVTEIDIASIKTNDFVQQTIEYLDFDISKNRWSFWNKEWGLGNGEGRYFFTHPKDFLSRISGQALDSGRNIPGNLLKNIARNPTRIIPDKPFGQGIIEALEALPQASIQKKQAVEREKRDAPILKEIENINDEISRLPKHSEQLHIGYIILFAALSVVGIIFGVSIDMIIFVVFGSIFGLLAILGGVFRLRDRAVCMQRDRLTARKTELEQKLKR